MFKKFVFFSLMLVLVLTACATPAAPTASWTKSDEAGAAPPMPDSVVAPGEAATGGSGGGENGYTTDADKVRATTTERLVIKNVTLALVVKNPQASADSITAIAEGMGGFVIESSVYQTSVDTAGNKILSGKISIRVPAEKLNEALAQIKNGVVSVKSETSTGQDVTAQYVDLQSQLKNLEATEKELQAIMEEAKNNPNSTTSSKTQDVLAVYNQLVAIRGQIETIKGQMKYYEESAAMSLIAITLEQDRGEQPSKGGGWRPDVVLKDAAETLVLLLQGLVDFLIRFGVICVPFILIFGAPVALVVWLVMRRYRKNKKTPAA